MANPAKVDHRTKLATDLVTLMQSEELCDIVFVVDGDERIPALKQFLMARSAFFRRMFQAGMRESSEKEIHLKETPAEAFKALLRYLYTGEVDLSKMAADTIVDLLELANRYVDTDLETAVALYLQRIFTVKLVCEILQAQFVYNIPSFLEECLLFVDQNADAFLKYDQFTSLSADVLNLIFQRNSFRAKEEDIFDAVVKWIEANSGLSKKKHKRILDCVRIGQIPVEKVQNFAEKSGRLTEKEIKRAYPRWTVPTENVATYENGAKVIAGSWSGGSIDAFLDGKTKSFTKDHKWCYHIINQPGESITIELGRPYLIGSVRFLLYDLNQDLSYSYYVETSRDGMAWTRVADKTQEYFKSWQDLKFTPRSLQFIKIVGTANSNIECNDRGFYVYHFECS